MLINRLVFGGQKKDLINGLMKCWFSFEVPELISGDKLYHNCRYKEALQDYSRVEQIFRSAQMTQTAQYRQITSKSISCLFMMRKHERLCQYTMGLTRRSTNFQSNLPFVFLAYYSSCQLLNQEPNDIGMLQMRELSKFLLSPTISEDLGKKVLTEHENYISRRIAPILNCRANFKNYLINLIDRPKPSSTVDITINEKNSYQIQLLESLAIIFSNPNISLVSTKKINEQMNHILQEYEKNKPKNVHKVLLPLICRLIIERNYMAAQGMIGYLQNEEAGLLNQSYKIQEQLIAKNLQRMMSLRAAGSSFDENWNNSVNLGEFVLERLLGTLH